MRKFESPLENIKIASPCSADWEQMFGDERKRFCGDCKLNVYNLSGMTTEAAEALVTSAEGRLCVRYYQRADGSVITQDCPVGWAKVKQRTAIYAAAFASLLMALFTGVLFVSLFSKPKATIGKLIPFTTPTPRYQPLMGAVAMPPPANTNTNSNSGQKPDIKMGEIAAPSPTPKSQDFKTGKIKVVNETRRDS